MPPLRAIDPARRDHCTVIATERTVVVPGIFVDPQAATSAGWGDLVLLFAKVSCR